MKLENIIGNNDFKKVNEQGGTFIVATFFNVKTKEVISGCVRDYDYQDCRHDIDELYNMPIDFEAKKEYLHMLGIIQVGDKIQVFKGRKVPVGTIGKVVNIRKIKDFYKRTVATYVDLDNKYSTNIDNCKLI